MNKEKVKKFVKSIQEQNKIITAEWDAGGDDTPCWFSITDGQGQKQEEIKQYEKYIDILRDCIIDTLDLPNAGEYYNKGKGIITYNDGEVEIHYSAKEFTNEYEEDILEFNLEDRFGLLDYQHKANIIFSLRYGESEESIYDLWADRDTENQDNFSIQVRILEGDSIAVTEEMHAYYKAQFEQIGKRYEAELGGYFDDKILCEVVISYNEKDELGKGFLKIDKYYQWQRIHEDEVAVLIS